MDYLNLSERLPSVITDEDSVSVLVRLGSKVSFLMKSLDNVRPSPHTAHCYREVLKGTKRHQKIGYIEK